MNFRANGTAVVFIEDMHYYPFGMQMEGMGTQNPANKYLYNGKELNDDLGLNLSDYGARWYDAALGRWWSVDPLAEKYQETTPYAYVANNPLIFIDPDGTEIWISFQVSVKKDDGSIEIQAQKVQYKEGKVYREDGNEYTDENEYVAQVSSQLSQLSKDNEELACRINVLEKSENIHTITTTDKWENPNNITKPVDKEKAAKNEPTGSNVFFDPKDEYGEGKRNPRAGLAHELLGHGYDYDQGTTDWSKTNNGIRKAEVDAINVENKARAATGDEKRTSYGGKAIPKEMLHDTHKQ
ncbi:MAG: hypothetical protein KIS77_05065 [Saprospiraceae bacterium]|nr:hypothetical protein [Saprospiraceae bacterium]